MPPSRPSPSGAGPPSGDEPLSVLLIEDNPEDARLFEEYLEEYAAENGVKATLRHEETLDAGLQALSEERPGVIVLDLGLPDSRSTETVKRATAAAPPSVPIVVLTGEDDLEVALSAQQAGAAQYLRKEELSPTLLGRNLRWAVQRSQMEARLRQRDAWIRSITESVSGGVFRVGATGRIEYTNDALARLLGFDGPEQLLGEDLTTFYAEPSARGTLLAKEGAETEEVEFRRRDGSTFTGLLSAQAARREDGTPIHFDGFITDVTEQKRAETQSRLQSRVLRQVADGAPLPDVLADLVEGIETLRPEMLGSVLLYDSAEGRIRHGAAPSLPRGYNEALDGLEVGPKVGSCGSAIHEGEAIITEDIESDPHWEDYRDLARKHGLRACWSVPIRGSGGEILGSFAMYYREPRRPSGQDQALIEEAQSLASLAIERYREAKRLRVLSEAVQQAKEAVLITEAEPLDEPGPEIVYVNEAFEEMTGYQEGEILGKTPRILQGPQTERAVLDSLRDALEAEEEWEGETVNYRKDGDPYRVQWNIAPVRGEGGEIEHWVSVQREVTEEREREKQLAQLAQALEQVDDKVFITDREGEIQYVNEAFEEVTGYREEEVVGETPAMLQSGKQDEAFYEDLWETILSGETFRAEFANEKKDGTRYVEDGSISPLKNEEGEITHFVSAGRDVTERKEREEALRRHRNLLQQTQRLAGAWEVDLRSEKLSWSDEVYRIHEVDPGTELETGDGIEFYAPEARPKIREAFERCVEEGEPYDLELPLDTAKGNRRWVRTVGAPSEIENGEIVKVAGAFQDITDRKEAERELAESEERYRTLAEHFPNGAVGVYDHDLQYSLAEGELLGTRLPASDELEGNRMPDIFPEPTASDLEPMFRAAVEEGVSGQRETTFNERIWRVWATPLRGPEGEIFAGLSYAQDITEHKKREQTLREQRNLLNQTQRLAGGWQVDLGSGKVSWSEEVYRIHELPPDTEIGLDEAIAFFEAGAADELEEAFDRCIEESEPYDLELPLVTAEGNRRWVRTVGAPSERKNGEIVKVAGAIQDITERKEAEEALQEREAQLRGLANSIPGVVFQAYARPERDYGFHFVSEHAEEVLGIPRDPSDFFERCMQRVPEEEREALMNTINSTVDESGSLSFEAPFVKPSGEQIWLLGTATPALRGDELIYNGVILDITERKNAEQALKEREEYLSVTLQSIGDAVVATDRDGFVTEMNAVAERLTGWDQEEAKGTLLDDILTLHSARTGEPVESPADEVLRDGRTVGLANHTVLTSREGTEYQIADSAAPIQADDGELRGVVLVFRDVTEKYERRRQMERQNDLFSKAQDLANVGGWEYDVETSVHSWTDEVYRIYGVPKSFNPTVQEGIAHYHPDDRPTIREVFTRAVEEGEPYDLELRLVSADGEEKWVRTRGEPQVEDGEIVRVRGSIQDITERKNREIQLEEMHDRMELALDHTSSVIFEIDLETDQVSRVGAYERFFGMPSEEVNTREQHIDRAVHPDDRDDFREFYREMVHGERASGTLEYRTNPKIDDTRWIRDNVHRIEGEGRLLGLALDITERRKREQELAHQKALLEAQAEATIDGLLAVSEDRNVAFYNDQFLEIWDVPESAVEQEPVGKPLDSVLLDHVTDLLDNPEEFREKVEYLYEHPETESRDLIQLTDGRWLDRYSAPIVGKGEKHFGRLWVFRDVTERERRERELETLSARLQLALGSMDAGVFDWDLNTDEVIWDETSERLFGFEPGEFSGYDSWAERLHPDDLARAEAEIEDAIENERTFDAEYRVQPPDGEQRWIRARGAIKYDDGDPVRMIGIHTDVTERKEREERLREAKEAAEEAARLKSSMLANMSHEVRTPLTSMIGFSEILTDELEGGLAEHAQTIRKSGRRLMRTLDSVLDLSRLESGSYDLHREDVRLDKTARETIELMKPRAEERSIALTGEIDDPIQGRWSEGGLNRILENLVGNALKFTPEGGTVEVRAWEEEGQAALEVEDTGIGMDPEKTEVLFEPFRQESEGLDRDYEGTGLGLSIVRELVDRLGGTIEVQTQKGEGPRITVRLPTTVDDDTDEEGEDGAGELGEGNEPSRPE